MKPRYDMIQCYVVRRAYDGGHEFMQLRRAPGDFMGGTWQTIYGRIEGGETAWQAALRELHEEAGLKPLEFFQIDSVNTFYLAHDDCIWHVPGFCAIVASDAEVELNEEHDAFRWLARDPYTKLPMWPGERRAVAEICQEILDGGPNRPFLKIDL